MHITVKPHHLLDYLAELVEFNGVFPPAPHSGSDYFRIGNLLADGEIDAVTFTKDADDPCGPCKKLVDGICTDAFTTPEAIAFNEGFTRKYDYNMKMDTDLEQALPCVFACGQERSIDEVFALLTEKLTPEIILLTWKKKNRVENTYKGLDMAIQARANKK